MIATRSHSFSTSRMMCVENRIVLPRPRSPRCSRSTARCTSTSSPAVGSSKISTGGSWTIARAIDTFCFMPVLILPPSTSRNVVHLQRVEQLLHPRGRARRRSGRTAGRSTRPSPTRSCGRRRRCWRDRKPTCCRTSRGLRDHVEPGDGRVPAVGLSTVQSMRRVVVLPAPFGPSRPNISPGRTVNETRPRRHRLAVRAGERLGQAFDFDHGGSGNENAASTRTPRCRAHVLSRFNGRAAVA